VSDERAPGERAEQAVERLVERRALARSAARRPWMRIESARGMRRGRTSPETSPPGRTRPSSMGMAAKEMISSRRGSRPVVSRSTTQ
jgi:hypothetical protein